MSPWLQSGMFSGRYPVSSSKSPRAKSRSFMGGSRGREGGRLLAAVGNGGARGWRLRVAGSALRALRFDEYGGSVPVEGVVAARAGAHLVGAPLGAEEGQAPAHGVLVGFGLLLPGEVDDGLCHVVVGRGGVGGFDDGGGRRVVGAVGGACGGAGGEGERGGGEYDGEGEAGVHGVGLLG